jgi:hypothetical protein
MNKIKNYRNFNKKIKKKLIKIKKIKGPNKKIQIKIE